MKNGNLKKVRQRLKLTQAKLAERLEVAERTVRRWENGEIEIPHTVRLALREIEREETR